MSAEELFIKVDVFPSHFGKWIAFTHIRVATTIYKHTEENQTEAGARALSAQHIKVHLLTQISTYCERMTEIHEATNEWFVIKPDIEVVNNIAVTMKKSQLAGVCEMISDMGGHILKILPPKKHKHFKHWNPWIEDLIQYADFIAGENANRKEE